MSFGMGLALLGQSRPIVLRPFPFRPWLVRVTSVEDAVVVRRGGGALYR